MVVSLMVMNPMVESIKNHQKKHTNPQRVESTIFQTKKNVFWWVVEPTHLKHIRQNWKSSPNRNENIYIFLKPPPRTCFGLIIKTVKNHPKNNKETPSYGEKKLTHPRIPFEP